MCPCVSRLYACHHATVTPCQFLEHLNRDVRLGLQFFHKIQVEQNKALDCILRDDRSGTGRDRMSAPPLTELEPLREYLLAKAGTTEEQPFGPDALVFKVVGKMFALVAWRQHPLRISLKCEPPLAEMLRTTYRAVQPGYHLNKRHWNTVILDGSVPADEVAEMIDRSYRLVVKGLTKAARETLQRGD